MPSELDKTTIDDAMPSELDEALQGALEPLRQCGRVAARLPRFANTLCIGVHLAKARLSANIDFLEWGNEDAARGALASAIHESDLTLMYGSAALAQKFKGIRVSEAPGVGAIHSVPVTTYLPRLVFHRAQDRLCGERFGSHSVLDRRFLTRHCAGPEAVAVFTDHSEQARALFQGLDSVKIIDGRRWVDDDYKIPPSRLFFFSAPATAAMESDRSEFEQILVADDLMSKDAAFETHIIFRLPSELSRFAGDVREALAKYHRLLFDGAQSAEAGVFSLLSAELSQALACQFPRFSAMIQDDPVYLKNCLAVHHSPPTVL